MRTLNESRSVQPLRRRYMTASRTPLPDSSASEPSGLKMRSRATSSRSPPSDRTNRPSEPIPVCGAQSALIRPGVSANASSSSSTIA